jgi:hypothetical protein
MSDDTNSAVAPVGPDAIFQFLRDNFAVVSAIAVVGGIALATIFLSAYLSVFDWHLLWFVQYTDIITFGLIAVGVIGGSLVLLQPMTQTILGLVNFENHSRRRWVVSLAVTALSIFAFAMYGTIRRGEAYFHILFGTATIAFGVMFILLIVSYIKLSQWPNATQTASMMIFIVSSTVCFGQWLGYSVSETSQFDQDVYLEDETIKSAKLVIVLARHTVLLKDRMLFVVPTGDIIKFQTSHDLITIPPAPH